jgi:acetyltransferase-like isoleucine patch superfamily enzyme
VIANSPVLWRLMWVINLLKWRLVGLRPAGTLVRGDFPRIGRGAELRCPKRVHLGRKVMLYPQCRLKALAGHIAIGDCSTVGEYTIISARGSVEIGRNVMIAASCHITDAGHNYDRDGLVQEQGHTTAPIAIGDDVWLGAGVKVLPGVQIGDGAVVGAGAVVTRDVAPNTVVAGVPARVIAERPPRSGAARAFDG